MSMFDNADFRWRETYFVYFDLTRRPPMAEVKRAIAALKRRFQVENPRVNSTGHFKSLTLMSPDDYAALDISYLAGDEVREQGDALVREFWSQTSDEAEREVLTRLRGCNARFDVMHFEQVVRSPDGQEEEEMFDPSALLVVLDVLAELTEGIGVDPQSGTLL